MSNADADDILGAVAILGAIVGRTSAEQVLYQLLMLDPEGAELRQAQAQAARDYLELRRHHAR